MVNQPERERERGGGGREGAGKIGRGKKERERQRSHRRFHSSLCINKTSKDISVEPDSLSFVFLFDSI